MKVGGARVRVANTHLQHNSAVERTAQAEKIVELLGLAEEPTVLGVRRPQRDLRRPRAAAALHPLRRRLAARGRRGDGFTIPAEAPDRRIDYVLVTPEIDVRSAEVRPTLASDHLPVTAKLTIAKRSRELAATAFAAPAPPRPSSPSRPRPRTPTGAGAGSKRRS